jgi:hypothetical protein
MCTAIWFNGKGMQHQKIRIKILDVHQGERLNFMSVDTELQNKISVRKYIDKSKKYETCFSQ